MPPLLRSTFSHDFWTVGVQDGESESVELNVCMPTGVLILLNVNRNATLQEVKEVQMTDENIYSNFIYFCLIDIMQPMVKFYPY